MKFLDFLCSVFFCYFLILGRAQQVSAQNTNLSSVTSYHVGVILDMGSSLGRMVNGCISMGISDFYAEHNHYKTRLVLHSRDSTGEPLQALSLGVDLLQNNEVQAIIGPQTSNEAVFLVDLGVKANVPIISSSATSPFLSPMETPYFVRMAANDTSQVKAIAALVQEFRWREVVLVYEGTAYGNGVIPHLISALDEIRARVPYRSVISPSATDDKIVIELYKLMTMSTRVFVVHMSSSLASRVFSKVKELGMMNKAYAWIVTDGITNMLSSMSSSVTNSMQGVLGIRPYLPPSEKLKNFTMKWRGEVTESNTTADLNSYCLWAYDAVWALAGAAERVGVVNSEHNVNSARNSTNLMSIPVSSTGLELLQEILQSKFDGISGNIRLINGEIQPVAFQIVNVVEEGIRGIGFWTPQNGISQELNLSSTLSVKAQLWPGASNIIPRGWIMPVSGEKLKIGVPIKQGFKELVNVELDPRTNEIFVSGFCIEVFEAAVAILPYPLPLEYIGFSEDENYDDLLDQVYLQNFDGAVGDISIRAERFSKVDFTLPFTEAGVAKVVPKARTRSHSMWIFLEPLTVDLWLVIAGFFVATGIIIWVIENRSIHEFVRPSRQQIGMIFWDSISTMGFAQDAGERLVSRLSKFVVMTWLFVSLILSSSYTASLSSMLIARHLEELPNSGIIGSHSYALGTGLHYNSSDALESAEEYADELKKGSENGGVSAIVDEMPYIKLFLAKYRDYDIKINSTNNSTNGLGFAFPKGSPLVLDFSKAIAKLREDGTLESIEKKWFASHANYANEESPPEAYILNFYSFRGLFLIMGIIAALALIMSYVLVKYNQNSKKKEAKVEPLPNDNMSLTIVIPNDSTTKKRRQCTVLRTRTM